MKTLFLVCDKCNAEVEVEPLETFGYRSISCKNCDAELVFQNAELRERDVLDPQQQVANAKHQAQPAMDSYTN